MPDAYFYLGLGLSRWSYSFPDSANDYDDDDHAQYRGWILRSVELVLGTLSVNQNAAAAVFSILSPGRCPNAIGEFCSCSRRRVRVLFNYIAWPADGGKQGKGWG